MNILHLLSQTHLTGAEVYASTLCESFASHPEHNVWAISNSFNYPTVAQTSLLEVETASKIRFVKNVFFLRQFLKKNSIHVIHTHSRAAAKLAYWSTLFSKIAVVSTVHGVQHSSFSKKLFNQYGQFIITVCSNIKKHLETDFKYKSDRIKVIANPVSFEQFYYQPTKFDIPLFKNVAIIGRTTGPKGQRTQQVLDCFFKFQNKLNVEKISIVGGDAKHIKLPENVDLEIVFLAEKKLNTEFYQQFDLIIGSGRVCIEALACGAPCIAFGESNYEGLIKNEHDFTQAFQSNFGDMKHGKLSPELPEEDFVKDLNYNGPIDLKNLSSLCFKIFEKNLVKAKVERLYESAYFLKNYPYWIPILMYHKVPDAPISSEHKIFVKKEDFENHLRFFKNSKFTTLTFDELSQFRKAKKPFSDFPKKPLILTFDDGYQNNLDHASPLLKKYNFKAQIFLLSDKSINQNFWDQENSMESSGKIVANEKRLNWKNTHFKIASHGQTHKRMPAMSYTEAMAELTHSKLSLEQEFGTSVNCFAFTYGDTNEFCAEMAQEAGYDYALNTDKGALTLEENPYSVFRVNIFPNETKLSLWKKTSRWYRRYYRIKRGI